MRLLSSITLALLYLHMPGVCFADEAGQTIVAASVSVAGLVAHYQFEGNTGDSSGEEHDIYDVIDPVWKRVSNPDNPASYTKDSYVKINAKFWASNSLTYETNIFVDVEETGSFTFSDPDSLYVENWPSETTSHISDDELTDSIGSTNLTLTWKYRVSPSDTWVTMASQSGPHKIYRVYDVPECSFSDYTKDNIDKAVGKAVGKSTEPDIASEANNNVGRNLYEGCICGDGFQTNFDAAMGSYPPPPPPPTNERGMCCCRAEGLNCVLEVLGIGPYTKIYCNEMPEASWATSDHACAGTCDTHGAVDRMYWGGRYYYWEGAIRSGGTGTTAYAPGGGPFEDTHDGIADNWTYYWVWWHGTLQCWIPCTESCNIVGYGSCSGHSAYWDRF